MKHKIVGTVHYEGLFYTILGPLELSVIQSSEVSSLQGFLMNCRLWRNDWDHSSVRYIVGVCYSGESTKRGSTVFPLMLYL